MPLSKLFKEEYPEGNTGVEPTHYLLGEIVQHESKEYNLREQLKRRNAGVEDEQKKKFRSKKVLVRVTDEREVNEGKPGVVDFEVGGSFMFCIPIRSTLRVIYTVKSGQANSFVMTREKLEEAMTNGDIAWEGVPTIHKHSDEDPRTLKGLETLYIESVGDVMSLSVRTPAYTESRFEVVHELPEMFQMETKEGNEMHDYDAYTFPNKGENNLVLLKMLENHYDARRYSNEGVKPDQNANLKRLA